MFKEKSTSKGNELIQRNTLDIYHHHTIWFVSIFVSWIEFLLSIHLNEALQLFTDDNSSIKRRKIQRVQPEITSSIGHFFHTNVRKLEKSMTNASN